jgi:hypothetical protein
MTVTWTSIEEKITAAVNGATKNIKVPTMNQETKSNTYTSIENFSEVTGKRYRMLKEQKARKLTREEAFNETHLGIPCNKSMSTPEDGIENDSSDEISSLE